MTNKLEELKKEMEKAEAACDALDATYAARDAVCDASAAAYDAYNKELNKNNDK